MPGVIGDRSSRRRSGAALVHCRHALDAAPPGGPVVLSEGPEVVDADRAIARAHRWFENNSGWAPPDTVTLAEWMADDVCRCPDECLVLPTRWCEHGLASWWLILTAPRHHAPETWDPTLMIPHPERFDLGRPGAVAVIEAHEHAVEAGQAGYLDPGTGLFALTAPYLWARGCCGRGCRHCPFYTSP